MNVTKDRSINKGSCNGLLPDSTKPLPQLGHLTLRNKIPFKWKQDTHIFLQENAFENAICKMATILFWSQYVKILLKWGQLFSIETLIA